MYHPKVLRSWAAAQPKTARFCIASTCTLSCIFAFGFGLWLEQSILLFAAIFLSANATLALWAWFSYSYADKSTKLARHKAQNTRGLILYLICFAIWGLIGNQSIQILPDVGETTISNNHSELVTTQEASFSTPIKPLAQTDKKLRGLLKKYLQKRQKQLRIIFKSPQEMSPVGAFFLFFFLGILALLLAYFLLILSCSLSCSGQTTLSTLVGISALISVLGGLLLIGYGIYRAFRKRRPIVAPNSNI